MPTVQQIIAAINPDLYYDSKEDAKVLEDFKTLIKEKGILEAAKKAKPRPILFRKIEPDAMFKKQGLKASYSLVYDSSAEGLEPVYFFLLDLMNDFGLAPEKLYDSFASSEGSGHFGDMGQRKGVMQQQGAKLLADINSVLRSVLNLVYDLREFKTRLQSYEDYNQDKDKNKKEAALFGLKQIWMDKVDVQKGNSSIKAMTLGQGGSFSTLIDAFLAAKNIDAADKLDLNQIVKRIVKQRLAEFNIWLTNSEKELKKRYDLERTYLKSQVNSLKLYSRWAKPYLKAANTLEMEERGRDAALVKAFNTLVLELTLLGKGEIKPQDLALSGDFPKHFKNLKIERGYYKVILADLSFRSIPQRVQGQSHYAFGGRAEFTLNAYALNKDELDLLYKILDKSEMDDVLGLIEGATSESLGHLQSDIDEFLEVNDKEEKKKSSKDSSNPFLALFGKYNEVEKKPEKKLEKKDELTTPRKDNWYEKDYFRKRAAYEAVDTAFGLFDVYKKAHQMPSYT
jgi:hypothetical protein